MLSFSELKKIALRDALTLELILSHVLSLGPIVAVYFTNHFISVDPHLLFFIRLYGCGTFAFFPATYYIISFYHHLRGRVNIAELLFLSTHPRRAKWQAAEVDTAFEAIVEFVCWLPMLVLRSLRNAVWITISAISMIGLLPVSVRTRTTTIFNACLHRRVFERKCGYTKGLVRIQIGKDHRLAEESGDIKLPYPYKQRTEKHWERWNDVEYNPIRFVEKSGFRIARGLARTSETGEYTNSMGENKAFLLDTGDYVEMTEVPGRKSTISFKSSEGKDVHVPLSCSEANNLVLWIWQHSIDTMYGALEGRDFIIDRNACEMDVWLSLIGIGLRFFIFYYFGIDPKASNPVSIALLHLSLIAAMFTARQVYVKDWVKYRGKRVGSELCYLTYPQSRRGRVAELLRTVVDAGGIEEDKNCIPPVFIGDTNADLFLNLVWGIDCRNSRYWQVQEQNLRVEAEWQPSAVNSMNLPA